MHATIAPHPENYINGLVLMSYLGCFDLRLRVTLRTILKKLTGNPYSVSSIIMDRDGVEPPESEDNRFTVCPAPTYGISVHVQDTKYTFYQNVLK